MNAESLNSYTANLKKSNTSSRKHSTGLLIYLMYFTIAAIACWGLVEPLSTGLENLLLLLIILVMFLTRIYAIVIIALVIYGLSILKEQGRTMLKNKTQLVWNFESGDELANATEQTNLLLSESAYSFRSRLRSAVSIILNITIITALTISGNYFYIPMFAAILFVLSYASGKILQHSFEEVSALLSHMKEEYDKFTSKQEGAAEWKD